MNSLIVIILLPVLAALFGFIFSRLRNELSFIGTVLTLYIAFRIFLNTRTQTLSYDLFNIFGTTLSLYADAFTGFLLLILAFFGLFLVLYSFRYIRGLLPRQQNLYHFYLIANLAGANGLVLSKNLFLMLLFYGFLVLTSYGMLTLGRSGTVRAAKRILSIVGFPYLIMLLGIILLFNQTGQVEIVAANKIPLVEPFPIIIFILLLIGILAKTGLIPFHFWIPKVVTELPASTVTYIPVIMNNLLGIYLLTRISLFIFDLTTNPILTNILMALGTLNILIAVILAIGSRNLIRGLSFYAIGQTGYIILGIGTATMIGIAGGLFQMLNTVFYTSALILAAGSVEFRTKTMELNQLGGLAKKMPLTFGAFLITALAISGIPPLNGFFSQWLIFQGLLSLNNIGSIIFLIGAVLGSILTLISMLKLTQRLFLGQTPSHLERTIEVGFSMNVVAIILALFSITFGIFAQLIPLKLFILPALRPLFPDIGPIRFWSPSLITVVMISWIIIGIFIYLLTVTIISKAKPVFVGGETTNSLEPKNQNSHPYASLKEILSFKTINKFFQSNALELYNYFVNGSRKRKNEKAQA